MTEPASLEDPLALLDEYDFELPERCIAQSPTERREDARLLVLDRDTGAIAEAGPEHRVKELPRWLKPGDLLVVNTTRVLSARLRGRKRSGGMAEALLLGPAPGVVGSEATEFASYRALVKCTGRVRPGLELCFGPEGELVSRIGEVYERGEVRLDFPAAADPYAYGEAPAAALYPP